MAGLRDWPTESTEFIFKFYYLFHSNTVDFAQWLYSGISARLDVLVYGDFPRTSRFVKHHLLVCKDSTEQVRFQYFRSIASVDQTYRDLVNEKIRSIEARPDCFAIGPASKRGSATGCEVVFGKL